MNRYDKRQAKFGTAWRTRRPVKPFSQQWWHNYYELSRQVSAALLEMRCAFVINLQSEAFQHKLDEVRRRIETAAAVDIPAPRIEFDLNPTGRISIPQIPNLLPRITREVN